MTDPRLTALLERHAAREPGPERILLRGGSVLSMDSRVGDFAVGDVLVDGDRIAEVGPSISAPDAVVVDARDHVVMPGFCDPHIHCWEGVLGRIIPENVPQSGERDALARELQDLVRDTYSRHAYPRAVHFVDALPKTPSGKVQRFQLR